MKNGLCFISFCNKDFPYVRSAFLLFCVDTSQNTLGLSLLYWPCAHLVRFQEHTWGFSPVQQHERSHSNTSGLQGTLQNIFPWEYYTDLKIVL